MIHRGVPAAPPADSATADAAGRAERTLAVLIVDAGGVERLDALLRSVTDGAGWSKRGSIIVWQVTAGEGVAGDERVSRIVEGHDVESIDVRGDDVTGDGISSDGLSGGSDSGGSDSSGSDSGRGGRSAARALRELTDRAPIEAGQSYYIPPGRCLRFEQRQVIIEEGPVDVSRALDRLMLSLAESWGDECVCALAFSGADQNGCGARIVRGVGGLLLNAESGRAKRLPWVNEPGLSSREPVLVEPSDVAPASPTLLVEGTTPSLRPAPVADGAALSGRVFSLPARAAAAAREACAAAVQRGLDRGRARVWVPRCENGGMTYAVAMLLADAARVCGARSRVTIFATDDDDDALTIARGGRYPARAALGMDPALRGRYTVDDGETIRVSEALRELCVFAPHDLLRDPPMAQMDLVVCHRVFDGVPAAQHGELIESFYFALRHGGVLLALDHADHFPEELFERVNGGFLRARPGSAVWTHRPHRSAQRAPLAAAAGAGACAGDAEWPEPAYAEVALPLIVCEANLRTSFISRAAMVAFRLFPADTGAGFLGLAGRLPGGVELVQAVRRVLAERGTEELAVQWKGRAYLARIASASSPPALRDAVSIAYVDVTSLQTARMRAVSEQQRQSALVRISEVGASLAAAPQQGVTLAPLYEEALAALVSNNHSCTAGAIAELAGGSNPYEIVASRGLGAAPMRTLRGMGDAITLLEQAVARECVVSQYGARVSLEQPLVASKSRSARARQALGTLTTGLACPILGDGLVIGVLVLFGRQAGLDSSEHLAFAGSVARLLGAAAIRQRARRGLEVELGVRRQLSDVSDLKGLGECLARVFESQLGATVELWSARDEALTRWERRFPQPAGEAERAWLAGLTGAMSSSSVLRTFESDRGEVLVPIEVNAAPRFLLRLHGAALRIVDGELAQSLKRVGVALGACIERADRVRMPGVLASEGRGASSEGRGASSEGRGASSEGRGASSEGRGASSEGRAASIRR